MNETTAEKLLQGKTVLFVDDRKRDIVRHLDRLTQLGAGAIYRSSPNRAWDYLRQHINDIDLVVADLFMPQDYSALQRFEEHLGNVNYNQGRLLEYAIAELKPDGSGPEVIYLSNDPAFYGNKADEDKAVIFSKNGDEFEEFEAFVLGRLKCSG